MNYSDIRDVLRVAMAIRRQLETAKTYERIDVQGQCIGVINKLKSLDIPPYFKAEAIQREAEIGAYEDFLRRWLKSRGQSAPVMRVEAALVSPDGSRLELGKGVDTSVDFETYADEGTAAHETAERWYARKGITLRVIDGGKK